MGSSVSNSTGVVVCGLGASTSVGRGAWTSAAAVRAGITGFVEHAFMVDDVGRPMHVAACPWLAAEPEPVARMIHCVESAIEEAAGNDEGGLPARTRLIVALPAARPGLDDALAKRVEAALASTFASPVVDPRTVRMGHAGGLLAFEAALAVLTADPRACVIVAGTDSWLDPDALEWLESTGQLHGAGERNNAWGLVPGEGAGAVLLARRAEAEMRGWPALAEVGAVGSATERHLIRTGEVCVGAGLSEAFRGALRGLPQQLRISDVYCDMNGEPYRADEYGFTVTRTRERFEAASEFVAPADCWGDVGAASGPLLAVLAVVAHAKQYARGGASLLWASSDSGERAAALLLAEPSNA